MPALMLKVDEQSIDENPYGSYYNAGGPLTLSPKIRNHGEIQGPSYDGGIDWHSVLICIPPDFRFVTYHMLLLPYTIFRL